MPTMNRVCDKVPAGPACRTSRSVIRRGRCGMANEGRRKRPKKKPVPISHRPLQNPRAYCRNSALGRQAASYTCQRAVTNHARFVQHHSVYKLCY